MPHVAIRYDEVFRDDYVRVAAELDRIKLPLMDRDTYELLRRLMRVKHGYSRRHESWIAGGYHGLFAYALARARRPGRVIDVGTCWGFSAICAALGLDDAGASTKVHSIDVTHHTDHGRHPRFDALRRAYVVEHIGASRDILPSLVDGPVDLAVIDGSHRSEDVLFDASFLGSFLSESGVMILDDCVPPYNGVIQAVAKVKKNFGFSRYDFWRLAILSKNPLKPPETHQTMNLGGEDGTI